ncbi:porin [Psychrosphaera ytuae]|uniref:Porin n=1 Tax=Psychrosphaera ytuae TaxID=2820710 RepID=A0A975DBU6_9GAMM|nr:porin [Psychrosphaera ytuae]QTH64280.1 porin [Psychrosphaera ytuae]
MKFKTTLTMACVLLTSANVLADVKFTGFASINAGKVLSGDGVPQYDVPPTFLADYPIVSTYSEEWSFREESLFGIQISADLTEKLTLTGQIVSRGADDFKAKIEWAFLSYEINDNWTFQAGKKRLPLFYYSDFYDVGFAYTWMRPPADTYTWQVFNYNGANVMYTGNLGDWSLSTNVYMGSEESTDNRLLSQFFFLEPTTEIWKDIFGAVANVSNEWLEIRLTGMTYTNERTRSGIPVTWGGKEERDGTFLGLAVNVTYDNAFLLTELNQLELDDDGTLDSLMVSVGYNFDGFIPFIAYSELEQTGNYLDGSVIPDGENHNTFSVGFRYDFHASAAFKMQYDKVEDNSFEYAVAGDSSALTFGVDLVF